MLGIIDVGGGMRGTFTAGVYDFLLDTVGNPFDLCLGVSAGSANLVTYLAGQRGRNQRFYDEYAFRKQYMSVGNFLRKGSYIDLDYVYTTLSAPLTGEDPIDLEAFNASRSRYEAVVTVAKSGKPDYIDKSALSGGDFSAIKGSCAVPGVCKPYPVNNVPCYDGGISDPIPYRRAMDLGCDRLVLLLTRPVDFIRPPLEHKTMFRLLLTKYKATYETFLHRHEKYNEDLAAVKEMETRGQALIVAPPDIEGMSTLTKNKAAIERLYRMGYAEAEKIKSFIE